MPDKSGVKQCSFEPADGGWKCVDCGRLVRSASARPPVAVCRPKTRGLGDMVADGLSAVGITKERVSAVVGKDCGCSKRQAALNEWGRRHLGIGVDTPATVVGERDADAQEAAQEDRPAV